jgi:toxin secretion/phage lysis holin
MNMDTAIEAMRHITFVSSYWAFVLPLIGAGIDIFTGWIQATINGTWDSTKMKKGLFSKFGEFAVISFVWIIDVGTNAPVDMLPWASGYILLTECVSILENIDHSGVNIKPLKRLLKKATKVVEDVGDDEKETEDA